MRKPKITVITTAYNVEKYIKATIASVRKQSFENFEYLIVDDGSTDGTADIIKRHSRLDSRIQVFTQKNSGAAAGRNTALRVARGEFIAFIDGDDIWDSRFLERQYETMQKQSQKCVATFCWSKIIHGDSKGTGEVWCVPIGNYDLFAMMEGICPPGNGSSLLIRKSAFKRAGAFKLGIVAEDSEMWYRILANHKGGYFHCFSDQLIKCRRREGSWSGSWLTIERVKGKDACLRDYAAFCGSKEALVYTAFARFALSCREPFYALKWINKAKKIAPEMYKPRIERVR